MRPERRRSGASAAIMQRRRQLDPPHRRLQVHAWLRARRSIMQRSVPSASESPCLLTRCSSCCQCARRARSKRRPGTSCAYPAPLIRALRIGDRRNADVITGSTDQRKMCDGWPALVSEADVRNGRQAHFSSSSLTQNLRPRRRT